MRASRILAVSLFALTGSDALADPPGNELYDVLFLLDPSGSVSSQWCLETQGIKAMIGGCRRAGRTSQVRAGETRPS